MRWIVLLKFEVFSDKMWENTSDFIEIFKNFPISITVLCVVPIVLLSRPIDGTHEFPVFRMQQFDLQQAAVGSQSALINMEARPLSSEVLTRRCVLARLQDLTIARFRELITQGAGAVLILLPRNMSHVPQQSVEEWQELESLLFTQEVPIAVYFAYEDNELSLVYQHVSTAVTSDKAGTAFEALLGVASASGYQMVASSGEAKQKKDSVITSIQGKLPGMGIDDQLPTVALVAHYDTLGIAPSLSFGSDSNGSGVVALLELARLFSRLYTDARTHARYNLVFFLSGGGKFNFQGTKKWLEDSLDNAETSVLNEVDYVLCLDSIGKGDKLFLHVSKPPKEGSPAYSLVEELKLVTKTMFPEVNFTVIHKKINLADETLSWEHERFSVHTQRLPAGTLSHFDQPQAHGRSSMFDTRSYSDVKRLERNVKLIAESLARHIFNLTTKGHQQSVEVFKDALSVDRQYITTWMDYLSSQARPAQLITKDHQFLHGLEQALTKSVRDVKRFTMKADKRDPEFVFYDQLQTTMYAYRVKPAIFDLFLAAGIASYLGLFYLALQNFSLLSEILPTQMGSIKIKQP